MDLSTRCPQCGTVFLASLEQLQLRKGYIRCVQCAHIFDGYEAVVPSEPGSKGPAVSPAPQVAPPVLSAMPGDARGTSQVPSSGTGVAPAPMPSVVRGRREFTISDLQDAVPPEEERFWHIPDPAAQPDMPPPADTPSEPTVADVSAIDVAAEDVDYPRIDLDHVQVDVDQRDGAAHYNEMWRQSPEDAPSRWWRTLVSVVWLLVIVVGLAVLAVQLVYVFRVQIAENVPVLRPALERLCVTLECTVSYSRQPDMIVITQSSLQQDPGVTDEGMGEALLQLTMRNVLDRPQEWPTIVLELEDFAGATIARKHLPRQAYLPVDRLDQPFPADSEYTVTLPLKLQGLQVNGYKLTTFFP